MPPQIRLRPNQVADLAEIRDTPSEILLAIAAGLQAASPPPMRPKDLQREMARVLGADRSEATDRIIRPFWRSKASSASVESNPRRPSKPFGPHFAPVIRLGSRMNSTAGAKLSQRSRFCSQILRYARFRSLST